jgi:hypothetical protein
MRRASSSNSPSSIAPSANTRKAAILPHASQRTSSEDTLPADCGLRTGSGASRPCPRIDPQDARQFLADRVEHVQAALRHWIGGVAGNLTGYACFARRRVFHCQSSELAQIEIAEHIPNTLFRSNPETYDTRSELIIWRLGLEEGSSIRQSYQSTYVMILTFYSSKQRQTEAGSVVSSRFGGRGQSG